MSIVGSDVKRSTTVQDSHRYQRRNIGNK